MQTSALVLVIPRARDCDVVSPMLAEAWRRLLLLLLLLMLLLPLLLLLL